MFFTPSNVNAHGSNVWACMLDDQLSNRWMEGLGHTAWVPRVRRTKSRSLKSLQLNIWAERPPWLLIKNMISNTWIKKSMTNRKQCSKYCQLKSYQYFFIQFLPMKFFYDMQLWQSTTLAALQDVFELTLNNYEKDEDKVDDDKPDCSRFICLAWKSGRRQEGHDWCPHPPCRGILFLVLVLGESFSSPCP